MVKKTNNGLQNTSQKVLLTQEPWWSSSPISDYTEQQLDKLAYAICMKTNEELFSAKEIQIKCCMEFIITPLYNICTLLSSKLIKWEVLP
jgi:hypothetical protein